MTTDTKDQAKVVTLGEALPAEMELLEGAA
jgi:hypothetical protein